MILLTFDIEGLYGNADRQIYAILQELDKYHAHGTFFFTATYAQQSSEMVEAIVKDGHEIGCHGFDHYTLTLLHPNEVEQRLEKAVSLLKRLGATTELGFRAPNFAINPSVVKTVEHLGFLYDSSVLPSIPIPSWYGFAGAPIYPYHLNPARIDRRAESERLLEIPLAVFPRLRLPCFGGWWLRNLGEMYFRTGLDLLLHEGPATVCLHDWEFLAANEIRIPAQFESEHAYPPFTFRNTGAYVAKAFNNLLKDYGSRVVSVDMAINENMLIGN